jgi:hypothetical protein
MALQQIIAAKFRFVQKKSAEPRNSVTKYLQRLLAVV